MDALNIKERVVSVMCATPSIAATAPVPMLSYEDFSFSYAGTTSESVLRDITWEVARGSYTLLCGDTGCGKTTLLTCAHPVLAPQGERSGLLKVLGKPFDEFCDEPDAVAHIAYVAQNPDAQIVCDSVWHELAFGLENRGMPQDLMRRRVAETAHFFGIEAWFHRSCDELSGGQKQLMNLASVLCLQPELLLLDEPTAQLDPVAAQNFLHALFRVNRELGITVVVATHDPASMASYATAVARMGEKGITVGVPDDSKGGRAEHIRSPRHGSPQTIALDEDPFISVSSMYFRFDRKADWVARGVDVEIGRGEVHAIVGGNGCGKTTLLDVMAGVCKPQRGSVHNRSQAQVLLPQDPQALLVCDTVSEELREWQKRCAYSEADIESMVARFDLGGILNQHPLDTSGGQQQKIALAKLLLTKPDLLLLDEPTKGFDATLRRLLMDVIDAQRLEGTTVVLVTHDLAFAVAVADRVTMLFDGEVASTEPVEEFFEGNLFFRPTIADLDALGLA